MAGVKMKVLGMRALQKKAQRLERRMRKRVYSKAVREASRASVLPEARSRAPVDRGVLEKSIKVRANNKPSRYLYGVKVAVAGRKEGRVVQRRKGGGAYYPDWVLRYYRFPELGTKYHPAKPFLKPALEASRSKFLSELKHRLHSGIEQAAR